MTFSLFLCSYHRRSFDLRRWRCHDTLKESFSPFHWILLANLGSCSRRRNCGWFSSRLRGRSSGKGGRWWWGRWWNSRRRRDCRCRWRGISMRRRRRRRRGRRGTDFWEQLTCNLSPKKLNDWNLIGCESDIKPLRLLKWLPSSQFHWDSIDREELIQPLIRVMTEDAALFIDSLPSSLTFSSFSVVGCWVVVVVDTVVLFSLFLCSAKVSSNNFRIRRTCSESEWNP